MKYKTLTRQKWENQLRALWPALKGSLAKVAKPCIRKNCPACACGDKHPAWILSFTLRGKRKTMYVPLALVVSLKKGLQNGPDLLKQHRQTVKKKRKHRTKS